MITRFAQTVDNTVAATDPEAWKSQVTTGYGENLGASWTQTVRERLFISRFRSELVSYPGEAVHESAATVGRRMLKDGSLTEEEVAFAWNPSPEWEDAYGPGEYDWQKIGRYIRAKDPEAKLDLRTERLERRSEVYSKLRAEEDEITARSTGMGVVGALSGGMAAYMVDPPNVAALVLSPWSAAGRLSTAAKYAMVAGEQVVVEAVTASSVAGHRQALGLEYGSKEIATDISMSVAGALAFKGLFDAGAVLTKKIKTLKNSPVAETPEGQRDIKSLTDALAEVKTAEASGRPLEEVLDATDGVLTRVETPPKVKDITDPAEFPEVKDYEQDAVLMKDYEAMLEARRAEAGAGGVKPTAFDRAKTEADIKETLSTTDRAETGFLLEDGTGVRVDLDGEGHNYTVQKYMPPGEQDFPLATNGFMRATKSVRVRSADPGAIQVEVHGPASEKQIAKILSWVTEETDVYVDVRRGGEWDYVDSHEWLASGTPMAERKQQARKVLSGAKEAYAPAPKTKAMLGARGPEADDLVPVSVYEVDGKAEIEYKSSKEMMDSFDAELEKTYKMRACFGL